MMSGGLVLFSLSFVTHYFIDFCFCFCQDKGHGHLRLSGQADFSPGGH